MSDLQANHKHFSKAIQFTSKHPKVHGYNPITHLDSIPVHLSLSFDAQISKSPYKLQTAVKPLNQARRFGQSVPRNIFADPLTGRTVDVSQVTPKRATLAKNGRSVLGVFDSPKVSQSLNISPRAAKTRVRRQVYDPITGTTAQFSSSSDFISSLGRQGVVSPPIYLELTHQEGKPMKLPMVHQRKKSEDSPAYLSPYQS